MKHLVRIAWFAAALGGALTGLGALQGARAENAASPVPAERKAQRENELKSVHDALASSAESRRQLEAELAELATDRAKLSAALIETAERARATEDRIRAVEDRLKTLTDSEAALRRSLEDRRGAIGEVLAALQRMGRRPPPAVLVRPEDILEAIRASMLLSAVLPEMRQEVEVLALDLGELVRLSAAITADRDVLARDLSDLRREQERLGALIAARQARLTEAERSFSRERERASALGQQAKSLGDLAERVERGAAPPQSGTEAERGGERHARERLAALAFRDPARLAPKAPFAQAKGLLPRPVSGETARAFGSPDGYGGTTRGVSIVTRAQAAVSSPSDGTVIFAGPFRSYGRLVILDAGGGYYVLMAGMSQINVEVGQSVLAGEPIAQMGATASAAPGVGGIEASGPVLYVEFRKDGASIDPGPWWAKSQGEKVRG
jgi:murein hydrolase activator